MTLLIEDRDVRQLLSMKDCIEAMEWAFKEYALGVAVSPPRLRYRCAISELSLNYHTNIHAGAVPHYGTAALRSGSALFAALGAEPVVAGIKRRGMAQPGKRNRGIVLLYRLEDSELLAIIHEFTLSGIRVPATTAVGVKYLARENAETLGLLGTGKLAKGCIEAIALVRPIKKVKVYSPSEEHRRRFCEEMSKALELDVTPEKDARDVVEGADILCCATNSLETVFNGEWLVPGQLVTTIENSDLFLKKSEADETTFVRSDVIVINSKESVFYNQQVELLDPIEKGLFTWDKVHELGEILTGEFAVPSKDQMLIYFKNNTGMGMQFAAAGAIVYREAVKRGVGRELPTEWFETDLTEWYEKGYYPSD